MCECFFTAKVVDLDPCLTKKSMEDSACHPYNTRGSMSEVQSLSSFQSESCDDNGMCLPNNISLPVYLSTIVQSFLRTVLMCD